MKNFLSFLFILLVSVVHAQFSDTIFTSSPVNSVNVGAITFEVNSEVPINITSVGGRPFAGDVDVWYRVGGVRHQAGVNPVVSTDNDWIRISTAFPITTSGLQPVTGNIAIPVNPGTTVGICINGNQSLSTTNDGLNTFKDDWHLVEMDITQNSSSFTSTVANFPNLTTNTNARRFVGFITYETTVNCTTPPVAGNAVAEEINPCLNGTTRLSLSGANFGNGQQFQWQKSTDGGTTWADMVNDTTPTALAFITGDAHYRCVITCGGTSTNSNPVQVTATGVALSGNYTINSGAATSGTNFASFNDFIDATECGGLAGPVVVNVVSGSGPYFEKVVFNELVTASSTNTITINGNGNVLESNQGVTADRSTVLFNGADWITINDLHIKAVASFGWVVHLTNNADHNTFTNNTFETSISINNDNVNCVVLSGSPSSAIVTNAPSGSHNTFDGNIHIGGQRSIAFTADYSNRAVGNKVMNSEFRDFHRHAVSAYAQDGLQIINNEAVRNNRTAQGASVLVFDFNGNTALNAAPSTTNLQVIGNRIHDIFAAMPSSTQEFNAFRFSAAAGTVDEGNVLANNVVYDINHMGVISVMYFTGGGSSYWKIYHNTFAISDPASQATTQSRIFYNNVCIPTPPFSLCASGSSDPQENLDIRNNLFYMDRGSDAPQNFYVFDVDTDPGIIDYNAYYSPIMSEGNVRFAQKGGDNGTFTDWQGASASGINDANGVYEEIDFVDLANGNLQPSIPRINNRGTDLSSVVPFDIDSVARPAFPDPGAWEFDPADGPDITVSTLVAPGTGFCAGNNQIEVNFFNQGTDVVDTIYVSWSVNGVAQNDTMIVGNFVGSTEVPAVIGSFNMVDGDVYQINVSVDSLAPGFDIDMSNNNRSFTGIRTGLAGNYTINQNAAVSATNFASVIHLATELSLYGVCGPVTVEIVDGSGPYVGQVQFTDIPGASEVNTVTIRGNMEEVTYLATQASSRHTISLNGVRYLTLDSLRINAEGRGSTQYGWGVRFVNNADYNTVRNCEILVDDGQMPNINNYAGIVLGGTDFSPTGLSSSGSYNTIENNIINGGGTGIAIVAPGTTGSGANSVRRGNAVINNTIKNFHLNGIRAHYQEDLVVHGNTIHRENKGSELANTQFHGIYLQYDMIGAKITNNTIRNTATNFTATTGAHTGITAYTAEAADTSHGLIANNMLYDFDGSGLLQGINIVSSTYWDILHNTIALEAIDNNGSGARTTGISFVNIGAGMPDIDEVQVKNNIISVARGIGIQACVNKGNASVDVDIDYNGYHVPSGGTRYVATVGSTNYTLLSDWQATGVDGNSIFSPPAYLDPQNSDYTPSTARFSEAGDDFNSMVPEDFAGVSRTNPPDLGALQFAPIQCVGVANFAVDSISGAGIFLSWDSDEFEWEIEWGEQSFVPGTGQGTIVGSITNNSGYLLTGIQPDTCIDIYVREICGSVSSVLSQSIFVCTPFENDMSSLGALSPNDLDCGDSTTEVLVVVQNAGTNPVSAFDVGVRTTGPITQTEIVSYTGTLNYLQIDTVSILINTSIGGNYTIQTFTDFPNDENVLNDTAQMNVFINDVSEPNVFASQDTVCEDTDVQVWVDPSIYGDFIWLEPGTMDTLGTSDTLDLLNVTQNTTVLLRTLPGVPEARTGARDNSIGGTGNLSLSGFGNQSLQIEVFETTTLRRATIYPQSGGVLAVALRERNGTLLQTINVPVTALAGGGNPEVITINMTIPPGEYLLGARLQGSSVTGLGINNNGASYPYAIPGIVSIDGSTNSNANYYPFYYDLIFGSGSCSRPDREFTVVRQEEPVAAFTDNHTIVSADANGFTVSFDATSSADGGSYTWDFGDGNSGQGDTISHTYTQNGTYIVTLVVDNPCGSDTITANVVVTGVVSVDKHSLNESIQLFPNPSEGRFTLRFEQNTASDLLIEILDITGKNLRSETLVNFAGQYEAEYDLRNLSAGVYMLRITTGEGRISRRVLLQ